MVKLLTHSWVIRTLAAKSETRPHVFQTHNIFHTSIKHIPSHRGIEQYVSIHSPSIEQNVQ